MGRHGLRWSGCGLLLISALVARADVAPDDCPAYQDEETVLVHLLGAESGKLIRPTPANRVMVRYGDALDVASLRFQLNGQDVSGLFRGDAEKGGDLVPARLPLKMGDNVLRVSGYLLGDIRDKRWRHCELPPLRWQELSIVGEPIKLGVAAGGSRLTPGEARALAGRKKTDAGEF